MKSGDAIWRVDALISAVDVSQGEARAVTHEVAGLGARFVAGFLDILIQCSLFAAISVGLVYLQPEFLSGWRLMLVLLGFLAAHVGYFLVFELVTVGETPGKNICALRVTSVNGEGASFWQLVLRNVLRLVDWLPGFYLLGLFVAAGGRSQRLGDRVARTLVMYQLSIREVLERADVAPSVYSTSDDGYMLESFVSRETTLREEVAIPLAHQLAEYLHRKYPPTDPRLLNAYEHRDYSRYLRERYLTEKEQGTAP